MFLLHTLGTVSRKYCENIPYWGEKWVILRLWNLEIDLRHLYESVSVISFD